MKCPICGSEDTFVFMKGIFDCNKTSVIECKYCGMQFLDKIMSKDEENEFYIEYYESQKKRQYEKMSLESVQNRSFTHYQNNNEIFNEILKDCDDILEIGSGSGGFLKFILDNYNDKKVISVERSEGNLEFLKNKCQNHFKDIAFYKDLSDIGGDKKFDLVAAFGVLEHARNSRSFLSDALAFLKNGDSKLVLNVPNKYNPFVYLFELEEFKKFSYMKMHYYMFTEKSLEILAEDTGCRINRFYYLQEWGLDNAFSWLINRKPSDFSRFTNFFSEKTMQCYKNDLIKNKMTDSMMVSLLKR